MKRIAIAIIFPMLFAGCAAHVIAYHPTSMMSISDASTTLVTLSKKNNDDIEIKEDFVKLDNGNRIYFNSVTSIAIYKKSSDADFGGAFSVYVFSKDGGSYVYRTFNARSAEQYVDALESLVYAYKSNHNEPTQTEAPLNSNEKRLQELQSLKNKGLITDADYLAKKKLILDGL